MYMVSVIRGVNYNNYKSLKRVIKNNCLDNNDFLEILITEVQLFNHFSATTRITSE